MPQRSARLGACPPPRPSRAYRGPVTTAIFDWAGTVLDFGCLAPVRAFREVFEAAGVPISEAEARAPMGAAKREHIERILADAAVQARWRAGAPHAARPRPMPTSARSTPRS
ncbi:hypothetical protein [Burkholderia glumae]|uniref:hypothetical protein n=1 Tax=Burkholderia glumae TaxID=337 RepID=UPI002149F90B|nr:hypothetical protein [Burkholderia glumae]